jgi:hypothetical protein
MSLTLHIVIHGAGPAFIREVGCPCVRCAEPALPEQPAPQDLADLLAWARQAHTAASLVIEADGVVIDHTLIDCGMGVMNNLAALPTPARNQPIHRILFTHGHFDHIAGLDGLMWSMDAARIAGDFAADEQPWPLPIWTTRHTWERYIGPNPADPADGGFLRRNHERLSFTDLTDAALGLAAMELHPALLVTPIPAEHLDGGVNFLFEFWPSGSQAEGDPIRVACCWDLIRYPAGRPKEYWQDVQLDPFSGPLFNLLHGADLVLIEMTNWRRGWGHITFEPRPAQDDGTPASYGVRDLITAWEPGATRIVHYSGWGDRLQPDHTWLRGEAAAHNVNPASGPVSDRQLRRALHAALGSIDIDIAQPGMTLTFG